jgi:hypothetical protein
MSSESEPDWEPEPDYETVYPRIVRRLRRLCADCGWQNVLAVFSNDMPEHREERAREEREHEEAKRLKRSTTLR